MCRCRRSRERGRGDPPHGGHGRRRPGLRASGTADGAVSRHRRGARGGGERRGRGRDGRRSRRGGAGDGAGGSCGCHADRRTERCDPGRDRACDRDATVQAPAKPDTTPVSSDTAAGIATTAAPATTAPAAAVQTSPTNLNVSVRIGSPGDNGPVTQVNARRPSRRHRAPRFRHERSPATAAAAPSTTSGAQPSTRHRPPLPLLLRPPRTIRKRGRGSGTASRIRICP